ncbi:hypothetical protein [Caballeronia sp. LZ035]|nr:hypothetical protein [Caballeronia sp. LZ035]MDR5758551.1 hypothetical protein [Caballeronia sp. LZ035]
MTINSPQELIIADANFEARSTKPEHPTAFQQTLPDLAEQTANRRP